ncbi:MAG: hypothetical protein C5B57_05250 [Blastocatellia bacterium]|nr:MAG: hypothetical protein C5B57_05250 [Blastocatellia bacterium]
MGLLVLLAATPFAFPVPMAQQPTILSSSSESRLYDENPGHLWNRLHAVLFIRIGADGRSYGADRIDPLLWIGSKYLLTGPAHEQTITLLHEFIAKRGERLIVDPVKRAILQRDLWTVFDWLEGNHSNFAPPSLSPDVVRRGIEELVVPLATVIARVALTPEQIQALPDNYAGAAAAGMLPRDVFSSESPWVSVGRPDGPVAAQHVRDAGPAKNSVFLVLIRLPDGRSATAAYLEQLRSFNGPLWVGSRYPNPDLPPFPVGTQLALVRRALLIDSRGQIVPTTLTEQVQIREYREIRRMTAQEFDDAHRIDEYMFERAGQEFREYSLSRAALFEGRSGGLLPLDTLDRFFLTFSAQGFDEFEIRSADDRSTARVNGSQTRLSPAVQAQRICKDCHAAPGVYSFNSYLPYRLLRPGAGRAARLSEISLTDSEQTAIAWKQEQRDWRRLKPLLQGSR